MHVFGRNTAIMITTSNSSVSKRSRTPNQLLGVRRHTMAISGLSRVRTELFQLLVIPPLVPHPVQTNRQSAGHRDLGGFPSPSHRQMDILVAPFGKAAHCDLRRFHQQKRIIELPCLVICPSRRRFPLDSSNGTRPR